MNWWTEYAKTSAILAVARAVSGGSGSDWQVVFLAVCAVVTALIGGLVDAKQK